MTNMLWGSVRKVLWKRCSLRNICYEQSIWKQIEKMLWEIVWKFKKPKNTKKKTQENQKKQKTREHQKNQRNQRNQKKPKKPKKPRDLGEVTPKTFPWNPSFFCFFCFFWFSRCFFFSRSFWLLGFIGSSADFFQRNVFFVKRCISVVLCICFHLTLAIPSQNPKAKKS